ncbi:MAG: DUF2752 domain-containing protein [Ruminococcus sp.]|nr:DUF2752 domain-containing protein [Ruminococcus sp.]
MTGYLCPGCGNTRAILSILHGHFLRAFAYNPTVPILLLVGLGFYGEMVYFAITGKHVHIVPQTWVLFYVVLGLILAYDVLRNIFPVLTLCY